MREIDTLQQYLLILNNRFRETKNSLEVIMILSKIKELIFWIEMYKEK